MTLEDPSTLSERKSQSTPFKARITYRVQCNIPSIGVPDANLRIQTSRDDPAAVKCNGIDLAEVAVERLETPPIRETPNLGSGIIAARDNNVALDF